jgi:spore germination cell wall hydrolase CwlJ-like protein
MTFTSRLATLIAALGLSLIAYTYYNKPAVVDISEIHPITELPTPIFEAESVLVKLDTAEFECMRANMYFEARNQRSDEAYIAVGYTVLNRVASNRYPNSICGVVSQARRDSNGNVIRNKCQFSWYCDGKPDVPNLNNVLERRAWERASELAAAVMRNQVDNPVGTATMYHATYVNPYWKTAYHRVATIETHIFYSEKA